MQSTKRKEVKPIDPLEELTYIELWNIVDMIHDGPLFRTCILKQRGDNSEAPE